MALPDPFKVLTLDQAILQYDGAVAVTWKNVRRYDRSTYRNLYPNQQVSFNPRTLNVPASASNDVTNTVTLQAPGSLTGTLQSTFDSTGAVETNNSKTVGDDSVTAVDPRFWEKPATLVEFWDAATVGQAIAALDVTLVSGNATVTVPDNTLLTPGQAIAGTGIPLNTIILEIPIDTPTSVILSNKATATGAQTAVLTGSNRVGYYYDDEGPGGAPGVTLLS